MPGGRPRKLLKPLAVNCAKARKRRQELRIAQQQDLEDGRNQNLETAEADDSNFELPANTVGCSQTKRPRKSDLFHQAHPIPHLPVPESKKEVTASQLYFQQLKATRAPLCNIPEDTITSQNNATNDIKLTQPPIATCHSQFIPKGREIFSVKSIVDAVNKINVHSKLCNEMLLNASNPRNVSSKVTLTFNCRCGWSVSMDSDSKNETYPINSAVALASAAVPIGFEDLRSLFTILDVSPPTSTTFLNSRKTVEAHVFTAQERCLIQAGKEEFRLAMEAGDTIMYKGNFVPYIKVVCDGSWSKRSYGHSYNSNYGTAAIIGARTQKVIFSGIRTKICQVCTLNPVKPPEHDCWKNWSAPSTAMEADIILEGFSKSLEMHGLIYKQFVADGDSSTYSRVKDIYDGLTVEKIECINHVIRNMNTKLRNIAGNSVKRRCISKEERSLPRMESRFQRIGLAVQSACRHYKALEDDSKWIELRDDIRNIPYHIFGRHNNCKDYFKCSMVGKESDYVDELKNRPMFLELIDAVERVASLSKSLIRRENSNIVECYFNVVAKYLEGKRKNLGGRSLYNLRIAAATISFNTTKFWAADCYKLVYLQSPSVNWKTEQKRMQSMRLKANQKSKRKPRILKFPFLKAGRGDDHYGTDPNRPDKAEDVMLVEMNSIKEKVSVTRHERDEIQAATVLQASSNLWQKERRLRITASNSKKIYRMDDSTDNLSTLRQLLRQSELRTDAIVYGRTHEQDAICSYEQLKGKPSGFVERCGLYVSLENGCLAASPDGVIGADGLLEVKCPQTNNKDIREWFDSHKKKSDCPLILENGVLSMNKKHDHYHQVVMQIFVTDRSWCDYFIWSSNGDNFLQRIHRNDETAALWENMKAKLIRFWENDLLPELADSRLDRKMKPRLPEYRLIAIKNKQDRLKAKANSKDPKTSSNADA